VVSHSLCTTALGRGPSRLAPESPRVTTGWGVLAWCPEFCEPHLLSGVFSAANNIVMLLHRSTTPFPQGSDREVLNYIHLPSIFA
jgi:hypothetical protein